MPVLPAIATRAAAKAATWAPMRNLLAGAAAYYTRHYNDQAAEPALELWQTNATSTAPVFWSRYAAAGVKGIEHLVNGISLRSPNGSNLLQVTNTAIAMTGTVTIGGVAVGGGVTVYNVLLNSFGAGYQLVTGTNSTNAAANSAALEALWTAVAGAGGGVIYVPPGQFPLEANTTLDHGLGYSTSVSLAGAGPQSLLKFYGTTGPYLNIATGAASALARTYIRDLSIYHGSIPTSGATIQLGSVQQFEFRGVKMPNSGSGYGAINCVALSGAASGISFRDCKFETRNDLATLVSGGLTPYGLVVGNTSASGGLYMENTEWSGVYTGTGTGRGTGIRFVNSALWDTVWIGPGTLIKDWQYGIDKPGGPVGGIANVTLAACHIDGCASTGVRLVPTTGGCATWLFEGVWIAGDDYDVQANTSNGGTLATLTFNGGYYTNATVRALDLAGVTNLEINGGTYLTSVNGGGDAGIYIDAGCTNVVAKPAIVTVSSGAAASVLIEGSVDPAILEPGIVRGKDVIFASTGTTRKLGTYVYKA